MTRIQRIDADLFSFIRDDTRPSASSVFLLMRSLPRTPIADPVYRIENQFERRLLAPHCFWNGLCGGKMHSQRPQFIATWSPQLQYTHPVAEVRGI